MKTSVSNREIPEGYIEEWDDKIWSVGFIFSWSEVFKCWTPCNFLIGGITVKPGETLSESFERETTKAWSDNYNIFFV